MHCVPLGQAAAVGAGLFPPSGAVGGGGGGGTGGGGSSSPPAAGGASCWVCIVLDTRDEVKKPGCSTLCRVPVVEAAVGLSKLNPVDP
jgi:fucokinase